MPTFIRNVPPEDRVLKPRSERAKGSATVEESVRFTSKLPGDARALRGIPAIGRSVGGAIPGTNPERVIDREPAA